MPGSSCNSSSSSRRRLQFGGGGGSAFSLTDFVGTGVYTNRMEHDMACLRASSSRRRQMRPSHLTRLSGRLIRAATLSSRQRGRSPLAFNVIDSTDPVRVRRCDTCVSSINLENGTATFEVSIAELGVRALPGSMVNVTFRIRGDGDNADTFENKHAGHIEACEDGTFPDGDRCRLCQPGKISVATNTDCTDEQTCCTPCPPGTYGHSENDNSNVCKLCLRVST